MAFKDVRDLSEHLKHLGYQNNFPISALYTTYGSPQSFAIVADVLKWLATCLEPDTVLPGGISNETERILLIRSAAEFFVTKAGVKLNPRRLYASSAAASAELLKITTLLMNAPTDIENDNEPLMLTSPMMDLGDKIEDLRRARELSSELTNTGASLYDLLAKELLNKETRNLQASRPLELSSVEKYLKNAIMSINQKLQLSKSQLEALKTEKNAVASKLERKSNDLDRMRQRLEALQKIRPAFLEEFERLESELKGLFEQYFIRIRTLDALRSQVANSRARMSTQTVIAVTKSSDASMILLPDGILDSDEEALADHDDENDLKLKTSEKREQKDDTTEQRGATTRLRVRTAVTRDDRRFVGNMMGGSDLDSSLGSDETDSEIDLGEDLGTDEDESMSKLTGDIQSKPKTIEHHSDEDF